MKYLLIFLCGLFLCGCCNNYSASDLALDRIIWQHGYECGKRNRDIAEGWLEVEEILIGAKK